jgi:predicted transcriptional regulator YheO
MQSPNALTTIDEIQSIGLTNRAEAFSILGQLAVGLRRLFDPYCEVVVHDFTDLEHSIVCLEGNITGRSIGGAATDLLLEKASSGETSEDLHGYLTSLSGGRVMKSSTIFLRDADDCAYGAFCVNFEITPFLRFQKLLSSFVETEDRTGVNELLTDNLVTTIQAVVAETLNEMGDSPSLISREDKIELILRLQNKGVFRVKKAVPILADLLGLSRATLYNYLREARVDRET